MTDIVIRQNIAGDINIYRDDGVFRLDSVTLNAVGMPTVTGTIQCKKQFWRLPSTATVGTTAYMQLMTLHVDADSYGAVKTRMTPLDDSTGVLWAGPVTADASGNFDLVVPAAVHAAALASDGAKRPALVHTWNGVTATTSIFGGFGIAEQMTVNVP